MQVGFLTSGCSSSGIRLWCLVQVAHVPRMGIPVGTPVGMPLSSGHYVQCASWGLKAEETSAAADGGHKAYAAPDGHCHKAHPPSLLLKTPILPWYACITVTIALTQTVPCTLPLLLLHGSHNPLPNLPSISHPSLPCSTLALTRILCCGHLKGVQVRLPPPPLPLGVPRVRHEVCPGSGPGHPHALKEAVWHKGPGCSCHGVAPGALPLEEGAEEKAAGALGLHLLERMKGGRGRRGVSTSQHRRVEIILEHLEEAGEEEAAETMGLQLLERMKGGSGRRRVIPGNRRAL